MRRVKPWFSRFKGQKQNTTKSHGNGDSRNERRNASTRENTEFAATKPCHNTSELDWWQLGVEVVLAIHVSGAWPINSQGEQKHQTTTAGMPYWLKNLKWKYEKLQEPVLKSKELEANPAR